MPSSMLRRLIPRNGGVAGIYAGASRYLTNSANPLSGRPLPDSDSKQKTLKEFMIETRRRMAATVAKYKAAAPPTMNRNRRNKKVKKIELPTHYLEVNYRTTKAVVFYGPNIHPFKMESCAQVPRSR